MTIQVKITPHEKKADYFHVVLETRNNGKIEGECERSQIRHFLQKIDNAI